jgi:hypothetical protein
MMKDINAQAYKVVVWLGSPSEKSELAFAKMRAVEASFYLMVNESRELRK